MNLYISLYRRVKLNPSYLSDLIFGLKEVGKNTFCIFLSTSWSQTLTCGVSSYTVSYMYFGILCFFARGIFLPCMALTTS